jgi:hypothetical protein
MSFKEADNIQVMEVTHNRKNNARQKNTFSLSEFENSKANHV